MTLATLSRHQWTSADYERMISASMFKKIELLWGDVVITGASANVVKKRWSVSNGTELTIPECLTKAPESRTTILKDFQACCGGDFPGNFFCVSHVGIREEALQSFLWLHDRFE